MNWLIEATILVVLVALAVAITIRMRPRPHRAAAPPVPARLASSPACPAPVARVAPLAEPVPLAPPALELAPAPEPAPPPPLAAEPAGPPPIVVEGRHLSPPQYRWLFPDLAVLPERDEAITQHFVHHGRHELGQHRFAMPARMRAVEFQRLSPIAPDIAPSDYWRYVPGNSDTLNIICSHFAPAGQFGPTIPQTNQDAQIYIKYDRHEFFQRGVPGLTARIDDTARWLDAVIKRLAVTRIRVVGFSAAGYGAIVFGHLLSADAIYAVGPELLLGRPQYRSHQWYPPHEYDPAYRDVRPFLPAMKDRLALLYPAYDPMEFRSVQEARAAGITNIGFPVDFHPCPHGANRPAMLAGPEALAPMARINPHPYLEPFDDETVGLLASAHELSQDHDYARSLALLRAVLERHPRNHGFACHVGLHEAITGAPDAGAHRIRAAREAIAREHGGYGAVVARAGKAIVRGFYGFDPATTRRLEALFDLDPVTQAAEAAAGGS